jgi:hypothetical protein
MYVAVVQEDINVLVLLMTLSPDDRDLYYLKPRRNNVLLNEKKFKSVFKYQSRISRQQKEWRNLMIHIIINDEPFQYKYIFSDQVSFIFSSFLSRDVIRTVAKWSPP